MPITFVFVGFEGGACSTMSQPLEVFAHAMSLPRLTDGAGAAPFKMHVATPQDKPLKRVGFFQLEPTVQLNDHPAPDLIFLTSMSLELDRALSKSTPVVPWLKRAHENGATIAAVCPSQALLASSGLLDGRNSAVHWSLLHQFKEKWPKVNWCADGVVIDEDRIVTSCGGAAATDLALYLIHKLVDEEAAIECARWFVAEMPRTRHIAPQPIFEAPALGDDDMKPVQDWLHTHYAADITFEALAEQFNMTERTFYRRFKTRLGDTPRVYLQKLRIAAAQKLLQESALAVDQISRNVGYEDCLFFRRLFKRFAGMTPNEYRERYKFRTLATGQTPS